MAKLLEQIESMVYPPRYGPEWGSGGIFGLKYYRGVIYFTLAFEAVAHFVRDVGAKRYAYELVGPGPRSGGDTYNAVEAVDEYIYFGGWVHAPAEFLGRDRTGSQILFRNKYSHIHAYNVYEDRVELLWKEGLGHDTDWVGEVCEIVYDPVNDRLLIARGDGMVNLGVYQIDRKGKGYKRLSSVPAQKGSYFYDHVCFDMFNDWIEGIGGVQCVDLVEDKVVYTEFKDIAKASVDGGGVERKLTGVIASAYGRLFLFTRGGVFVGNPVDSSIEPITFYRLFDFGLSSYGPRRTMAKPLGGGLLVAFNSYSETAIRATNEHEALQVKALNSIVGPSVMLFIAPPTAKIVAAFGARVTGFEIVGSHLLIACDSMANTFRYDAIPIDAGYRGFVVLEHDVINRTPPEIRFTIRGFQVGDKFFGGVPLTGYRSPVLKINSSKSNVVYIYEYDLSLPPDQAQRDSYRISEGKNVIELNSYRNSIVSFKLSESDPKARIEIDLA